MLSTRLKAIPFQILIATVLIILTSGFFIYRVLRPPRTFMAATCGIQQGDYGHEVHIAQRDAFGSFAQAFNIMLAEIAGKTAALSKYSNSLEVQVMETNEKLLQAQKMEAVGRLVGGIAHDFNNILTAICGYCDILAECNPADPPDRKYVQEIRYAADRAAALTHRLLAFSRKQILQPRLLDLNAQIRGLKKMLRMLLEVSDTGRGMDKEVMSHLFEPFFNAEESGKETSFKIYLPRADQQA